MKTKEEIKKMRNAYDSLLQNEIKNRDECLDKCNYYGAAASQHEIDRWREVCRVLDNILDGDE